MAKANFKNPFRPGAGHQPPYLAGRGDEKKEFLRLLKQESILENLILTGLRGVGKTVLLDTFKPLAIQEGWLWVGTDLSESTSISEENLAIRLMTDLSVITSAIVLEVEKPMQMFGKETTEPIVHTLDFKALCNIYDSTPGLVADKLKQVLEISWKHLSTLNKRGLIFAYDEAQNLADHSQKEQFPLSILLDVFQSIQKKNIPYMLALTGLPTLFPKLVEARTFSERMFRVVHLERLDESSSKDAILRPIQDNSCPVSFNDASVQIIVEISGGYPYFIQFICREVYDLWIQKIEAGESPQVPVPAIVRKLDTDFFAGRWSKATDRQRDLLWVISQLDSSESEFTVSEVAEKSSILNKPFSASHVNQMLVSLCECGLVYKNRHGKYSFAVPLLGQFIKRQYAP
jgi:hypothetical protein